MTSFPVVTQPVHTKSLPSYSEYNLARADWLGEIPIHWEVKRLKHICWRWAIYGANEPAEHYADEGVRFLRTSDIDDDGRLDEEGAVYLNPELVRDYILEDGDLLLSRSGTLGRSFVYQKALHGYCAYAGYLVRFSLRSTMMPLFAFYYTKSYPFYDWLGISVIQSTIGNVNGQKYGNMLLPVPPINEQQAIVAFLEQETKKIEALIAKKKRLINLLEERRAALISQAVTKGIKRGTPMKDSGVLWLGEVPAHWKVRPLKQASKEIVDCKNRTPPYVDNGEYFVVRTSNVRQGRLILTDALYTNEVGFRLWTKRGIPKTTDVLFTREAPAGEACLVPADVQLCLGQRMMYIRPDPTVLDKSFLLYSIYGSLVKGYIDATCAGSTVTHLKVGQVYMLPILVPPLNEQKSIVSYIDRETIKLETLISKNNRHIELLRERKAALITAAVTGKIDVRSFQRRNGKEPLQA